MGNLIGKTSFKNFTSSYKLSFAALGWHSNSCSLWVSFCFQLLGRLFNFCSHGNRAGWREGKWALQCTFPHAFFSPPPCSSHMGTSVPAHPKLWRASLHLYSRWTLKRYMKKPSLWPLLYLCVAKHNLNYSLFGSTQHLKKRSNFVFNLWRVSLILPFFQNENALKHTLIVRYIFILHGLRI